MPDEAFFICLGVVALVCVLAALPLSIIAVVLALRASRQIKALAWEVRDLAKALRGERPAEAAPRPAQAPRAAPVEPGGYPAAAAAGSAAPSAAPRAPAGALPTYPAAPAPLTVGSAGAAAAYPAAAAAGSGAPSAAPGAPAAPAAFPAAPAAGSGARKPIRWEEIIGLKLLGWAGVIVVLIGAALFIKYGYDQGWFGKHPWVRVAIPTAVGLALLAAGEVCMRKTYRALAQVCTGGGLAALYWAAYTAWARFEAPLVPAPVAWGFMAAITAVAILLSVRYASLTVAILSLVGGLAAPILIRPDRDPGHALFLYLLAVNGGVLVLAYFKKWRVLNLLALAGTILNVVVWLYSHYYVHGEVATEKLGFIVTYLTLLWAAYFALSVVHHLLGRTDPSRLDLPVTLINIVAYFTGLYVLLRTDHHDWLGPAAAVLGAIYLAEGLATRRFAPQHVRFVLFQVAQALGLLTLAIPIHLSGVFIPMAWAAEATILYWLGLRTRDWRLRGVGLAVHLASIVALAYYYQEAWDTKGMLVFNARTATIGAVALAMALSAWLYRRQKEGRTAEEGAVMAAVSAVAHLGLMALIGVEAFRWHTDARTALRGMERSDMAEQLRNLGWTADIILATGWSAYGLLAVGLVAVLRRAFHHAMAVVAFAACFVVLLVAGRHLPALEFVAGWNNVGATFAAVAACLAVAAVVSRYATAPPATARAMAVAYELLALGVVLGLYFTELTRAEDYVSSHERVLVTSVPLEFAGYRETGLSLSSQTIPSLWAAGLAAMAALVMLRGFWIRSLAHRVAGLAAMAVSALFLLEAVAEHGGGYTTVLWQPRGVAMLLLAAAMILAMMGYARAGRARRDPAGPAASPERRIVGTVLAVLVHVVILACFTLEAEDFWDARALAWFRNEQHHAWYARQATLSVGYALYAFGLLAAGIRGRKALLRIMALVLLAGTLAKVFIVDLSRLEAIWRILSFAGLGLLLLAASYLYYKYRHVIFPAEAPPGAPRDAAKEARDGTT